MIILMLAAVFATAAALIPFTASAHCPLCTVGAGLLAVTAVSLGVNSMAVGVFIGAFAIATGLWAARLFKKRYIPHQDLAIGIISFLLTIVPMVGLFDTQTSFSVFLAGGYGSWLNTTYLINEFVAGSVIGGVLLLAAPKVSAALTKLRGKRFPFQGLAVNFSLLIVAATAIQLLAAKRM